MSYQTDVFNLELRNALSDFREAYINSYSTYEIFKKRNPGKKIPQDKFLEPLKEIINKKSIDAIKNLDTIAQIDRSAGPTLRKYLGIKKDDSFDEQGRINQAIQAYESVTGDKISNISWSIKVRVKPKDEDKIYMNDSGQITHYINERTLYDLVWNKPEIYMPWTKFSNKQRKNMVEHIELLSTANVARFFSEKNPNKEVMRLESRIKGFRSLARKVLNEYMLQTNDSKAKLPVDILGARWVISEPKMLYSFMRNIRKNDTLVKNVLPEYKGPLNNIKDAKGAFSRLNDLSKLEKITKEALDLNEQYDKSCSIKRMSKQKKEELQKKLIADKKKMILSVCPLIETKGGPPIREITQTYDWKELDDFGNIVSHDACYYFERRDKIISARKEIGLDEVIGYFESMMYYLFEP